MVIKKSLAVVAGVALLAVGYMAGAYVGIPFQDKDLMEGSIGKAKTFNQTNDPEVMAVMEMLATDTVYQKKAMASALVLSTRIYQMDSLTKQTIDATENVKELEQLNTEMKSLYTRTQNARAAYDAYMAESAKIINGDKSEEYEQAANNALLAFTVLENSLSSCPLFIDEFASYLRENKNDAVDNVAVQWVEYCAEDAVLNDDAQKIDAWKLTYSNLAAADGNFGKSKKLGEFPSIKGVLASLKSSMNPSVLQNIPSMQALMNQAQGVEQLQMVLDASVFAASNKPEALRNGSSVNDLRSNSPVDNKLMGRGIMDKCILNVARSDF